MKSTKRVLSSNNNGQTHESNNTQQSKDQTMSLVYPDGRVTNVKVRQKKS